MKSHLVKLAMSFAVIGMTCLAFGITTTKTSATEMVDSQDVLEDAYAGAAEVLEVDTEPTEEEINSIIEANYSWKNPGSLVMADVQSSVNVRSEASADSEKIGKLYKDCGGYIIEYTDEWTKIQSGDMAGWVCNEYLKFGEEAQDLAEEVGSYIATVNSDTLRVRKEPDLDSGVYGLIGKGEEYEIVAENDEWLSIDFQGVTGYINSEFVEKNFKIDFGETLDQIEAREKAEAAAKREAERKKYYGVYAASASDVELLGALIQCEAGNQSYEGKVAVGAVVMNRVRSGAYPNSIYGVIYASGQFTPAGSGSVDRRIEAGVSKSCLQAAQEVIGGYSNVGASTHFRPASSGRDGIVIGGHVFW